MAGCALAAPRWAVRGEAQGNVNGEAGELVVAVEKNLEFLIGIGYLVGPAGEGNGTGWGMAGLGMVR